MRLRNLLLVGLIFLFTWNSWNDAADGEKEEKTKFITLDNGLKVILVENDKIPLVNIVFAVNMGSKNETPENNGMVHLLEHLVLLGGSGQSSGEQLTAHIRENGIFFNAHTMLDVMTLEITAPNQRFEQGLSLIKEKIFNLKLDPKEMEREKQAILEELSQIKDDPDQLGLMLAMQAIFAGHPYQLPVGGSPEIIRDAKIPELEAFYRRFFIPSNCSLAVVGDFKIPEMEPKIKTIFGSIKDREVKPQELKPVPPLEKKAVIQRELDIEHAHLFLVFRAPALNGADKMSMDILTQILGRGMNPLLYRALAARRQLAEEVSMSFLSMKYGGAALVHVRLEKKNLKTARNQLLRFFRDLRNTRFSESDYPPSQRINIIDYLETAKTWMRFSGQQYREKGLNLARSYARYILLYDLSKEDSYQERMDAVKSSDLKKAASDYLSGKNFIEINIIPSKNKKNKNKKKKNK